MARQYRVNEQIRVPRVRVIGEDGEQLGVMTVSDALSRARMNDLDLVEVAPNADPPVARLLDYGKLRYLTSKKERETRKSQKSNELKEVRFRPNIGTHDFDAKLRKVRQFIGNGDKVKLTVRFRGREAVHQQNGLSLLKRVAEEMKDDIRLEQQPSMEGRAMSMVLIPNPTITARNERKEAVATE
ncbi:MAG: translation initiation factor IF-3 [Chloroflexi bacterium]|nr:translation initiation factor IF-3 [Chloroflexota bacterium]